MVGSPARFAVQQDIKPLPTIEATDPKDMTLVEGVNGALEALSRRVTKCVDAGGKAEACVCREPQALADLRNRYHTMLQRHPEWKDQLVSYRYVNKEGRSISGTLVLSNLRRELEPRTCE